MKPRAVRHAQGQAAAIFLAIEICTQFMQSQYEPVEVVLKENTRVAEFANLGIFQAIEICPQITCAGMQVQHYTVSTNLYR